MAHLAEANTKGPRIRAQVFPRLIGMVLGFDLTVNPFNLCPSYQPLAKLSFEQRIEALRDPIVRARLLMEDAQDSFLPLTRLGRRFEYIFPLGDPPNYEPDPSTSVAAQAARRGVDPAELAYDMMMENGGRTLLLLALANYGNGNLDPILSLINDPNSVIGLGDGGAHYGHDLRIPASTTTVLQHWTRERDGTRMPIERAIQALTRDPAETVGLNDRGVLSVGRKADVNVIDHGRVTLNSPKVRYDLPAGGRRLYQEAAGYEATIVAGQVISREGQSTGALPGRLVRGAQAAPA